jgi:hypothetical protein
MKEPKADPEQLRDLGIQFSRHGITRREDRLVLVRDHAGRWVDSSAQLTWMEAATLQQRLRKLPVGSLPAKLDELRRAERRREAERTGDVDPGAVSEAGGRDRVVGFVCSRSGRGRGCTPITARDVEHARLAGEQLELEPPTPG